MQPSKAYDVRKTVDTELAGIRAGVAGAPLGAFEHAKRRLHDNVHPYLARTVNLEHRIRPASKCSVVASRQVRLLRPPASVRVARGGEKIGFCEEIGVDGEEAPSEQPARGGSELRAFKHAKCHGLNDVVQAYGIHCAPRLMSGYNKAAGGRLYSVGPLLS
ncbi:hypothetical protein FOMPIDRAFT_94810 [Fomitopsis schrenkii]|uniref:Uncharacterized protein n=1 Tax=Fomitopsis schrenkii TaxID=2126942 RepID=S8F152_FOMSC|nr:hypothetical protein FOMPIDRAFT_94810 [Fomitopsis schrenkii]